MNILILSTNETEVQALKEAQSFSCQRLSPEMGILQVSKTSTGVRAQRVGCCSAWSHQLWEGANSIAYFTRFLNQILRNLKHCFSKGVFVLLEEKLSFSVTNNMGCLLFRGVIPTLKPQLNISPNDPCCIYDLPLHFPLFYTWQGRQHNTITSSDTMCLKQYLFTLTGFLNLRQLCREQMGTVWNWGVKLLGSSGSRSCCQFRSLQPCSPAVHHSYPSMISS